jgi:hypothetical protein
MSNVLKSYAKKKRTPIAIPHRVSVKTTMSNSPTESHRYHPGNQRQGFTTLVNATNLDRPAASLFVLGRIRRADDPPWQLRRGHVMPSGDKRRWEVHTASPTLLYYLVRLSRTLIDLRVSVQTLDLAPYKSRKRHFLSVVNRETKRAMQAGITRGQCHCHRGFVVAQSTERFISKSATRRGRYSELGGVCQSIDLPGPRTSHNCAIRGNT